MKKPIGWKKQSKRVADRCQEMKAKSCVQQIRATYSKAIISKCKENNCVVKIKKSAENILILRGEILRDLCEKYGTKICDCVVIYEDTDKQILKILLVELKSKRIHASDIFEKLENGAKIVLDIILPKFSTCKTIRKYDLKLLLIYQHINHFENRRIRQKKILIKGSEKRIRLFKCGAQINLEGT